MLSPFEQFKLSSYEKDIEDVAYDNIYVKYIKNDFNKELESVEIDDTNQEQIIDRYTGNLPIPGLIYTFKYFAKVDETINIVINGADNKFVDFVPLVFCVNIFNGAFSGINLNALPGTIRLKFLESYYKYYKGFFSDITERVENNELVINKAFINFVKTGNGQTMIRTFSSNNKANFNYGYRRYRYENIEKLRMLEYNEWKYIPFLNPKEAFRKMGINQVNTLYWKTV